MLDINSAIVIGKIAHENEEPINFAVAPNQRLIAVTYKNHLVRIYSIGDLKENWKPESVVAAFKTGNMLGLELCFDPSSRYVAIATSDSQIKVYDAVKGF